VSRQDGALSELPLTKGYGLFGTSRDAQLAPLSNLVHLGVRDRLQEIEVATGQFIAKRPHCAGTTRRLALLDRL
jgi:GDPmannose 4,6-dehydratase